MKESYVIYTDGCSRPHFPPHNGGWAFVVLKEKEGRYGLSDICYECSGYFTETTNNLMEVEAIVRAVEWAPADSEVEIRSDSTFAIGLLSDMKKTSEGYEGLKSRYVSAVLGKRLRVRYTKVKGHDTDDFNNRADILTNYARNTADIVYGVSRVNEHRKV